MQVPLHRLQCASRKHNSLDDLIKRLHGHCLVLANLVLRMWPTVAELIPGPSNVRRKHTMQDFRIACARLVARIHL